MNLYREQMNCSWCATFNRQGLPFSNPVDCECSVCFILIIYIFLGVGIETGRGGEAVSALTKSVVPAVVTGEGHAAQSANLIATGVAAGTEVETEKRNVTRTENGLQRTKVKTRFTVFYLLRPLKTNNPQLLTVYVFLDRKMAEEKSNSKKDKHSEGEAAVTKSSSEVEAMETEADASGSSPLLNGQQELLQSEGDTQSN